MKKYIKKFHSLLFRVTNYLLKFSGYRVNRVILSDYQVIQKLIQDVPVKFIDIGANEGQSVDNALDYFNVSLIHSYEPLVNESILNKVQKWGGKLTVYCEAVGCNGRTQLYMNQRSQLNSTLPFSSNYRYKSARDDIGSIEVDCVTLDKVIDRIDLTNQTINILKIDTQGNEFNVLNGSKYLGLGIIDFVIIELLTVEKYQGIIDYSRSINILSNYGFKLIKISSYDEQTMIDGVLQATELNLLLIHNNTIEKLNLPIHL